MRVCGAQEPPPKDKPEDDPPSGQAAQPRPEPRFDDVVAEFRRSGDPAALERSLAAAASAADGSERLEQLRESMRAMAEKDPNDPALQRLKELIAKNPALAAKLAELDKPEAARPGVPEGAGAQGPRQKRPEGFLKGAAQARQNVAAAAVNPGLVTFDAGSLKGGAPPGPGPLAAPGEGPAAPRPAGGDPAAVPRADHPAYRGWQRAVPGLEKAAGAAGDALVSLPPLVPASVRAAAAVAAAAAALPVPEALRVPAERMVYEARGRMLAAQRAESSERLIDSLLESRKKEAGPDFYSTVTRQDIAANRLRQRYRSEVAEEKDPAKRAAAAAAWQRDADRFIDGEGAAYSFREREAFLKTQLEKYMMAGESAAEGSNDQAAFAEQFRSEYEALKAFYREHPELSEVYARREEHKDLHWKALHAGLVPDGASFSGAELGLDPRLSAVVETRDGRRGVATRSSEGVPEGFEALDGSMRVAYRPGPQGGRPEERREVRTYFRPDGKPSQVSSILGGLRDDISFDYDESGAKVAARSVSTKDGGPAGSTREEYDPKTGFQTRYLRLDAQGGLVSDTRFLKDGTFEVTEPRWFKKGEMVDGQFQVRSVHLRDAEGAATAFQPFFDDKGGVAGYSLPLDDEGRPKDLSVLVDNGFITPADAQRFERLQIGGLAMKADAGTGRARWITSPRIVLQDGHPTMVYEYADNSSYLTYRQGYIGGGTSRWVTQTSGHGNTRVWLEDGWNAAAGQPMVREEYWTHRVTRMGGIREPYSEPATAYRKSVLAQNGPYTYLKTLEEKVPRDDGVWDLLGKNLSWTFSNVHGYKQIGWATTQVAEGGKTFGYTISGGAADLFSRMTPQQASEYYTRYAVTTAFQGIDHWTEGAGGAAVDKLKTRLGSERFSSLRRQWFHEFQDAEAERVKNGADPREVFQVRNMKYEDFTDEMLGKLLMDGSLGEGFVGAKHAAAGAAAESETWTGTLLNGGLLTTLEASDFLFQSAGFHGIAAATGKLSAAAATTRTAAAAGKLGRSGAFLSRAMGAASVTAEAAQYTQQAYFMGVMGTSGIELADALADGDKRRTVHSLSTIAAIGLMPSGNRRENSSLSPGLLAREVLTTSPFAKSLRASYGGLAGIGRTLSEPGGKAKLGSQARELLASAREYANSTKPLEALGWDPLARTGRLRENLSAQRALKDLGLEEKDLRGSPAEVERAIAEAFERKAGEHAKKSPASAEAAARSFAEARDLLLSELVRANPEAVPAQLASVEPEKLPQSLVPVEKAIEAMQGELALRGIPLDKIPSREKFELVEVENLNATNAFRYDPRTNTVKLGVDKYGRTRLGDAKHEMEHAFDMQAQTFSPAEMQAAAARSHEVMRAVFEAANPRAHFMTPEQAQANLAARYEAYRNARPELTAELSSSMSESGRLAARLNRVEAGMAARYGADRAKWPDFVRKTVEAKGALLSRYQERILDLQRRLEIETARVERTGEFGEGRGSRAPPAGERLAALNDFGAVRGPGPRRALEPGDTSRIELLDGTFEFTLPGEGGALKFTRLADGGIKAEYGGESRTFKPGETVRIGRGPGNDFTPADAFVSGQHMSVQVGEKALEVSQLGRNPTRTSFEIGDAVGPNGHYIAGGKSRGRSGGREEIVVDWQSDAALEALYQRVLTRAGAVPGADAAGRQRVLEAAFQEVRSSIEGGKAGLARAERLSAEFANKEVLIGDAAICPAAGVCRHMGITNAAVLERLIGEGYLGGQAFYVRGPGHGWAVYRTESGQFKVLDGMQKPTILPMDPGVQHHGGGGRYFDYGAAFPKGLLERAWAPAGRVPGAVQAGRAAPEAPAAPAAPAALDLSPNAAGRFKIDQPLDIVLAPKAGEHAKTLRVMTREGYHSEFGDRALPIAAEVSHLLVDPANPAGVKALWDGADPVVFGRLEPGRFELGGVVSGRHFSIRRVGDSVEILDLGSRNGTRVLGVAAPPEGSLSSLPGLRTLSGREPAATPESLLLERLRGLERGGALAERPDADVLTELRRRVEAGEGREGTYYRVTSSERAREWDLGQAMTGGGMYKFVGETPGTLGQYGGPGTRLMRIRGRAVPYGPGAAEREGILYDVSKVEVLDPRTKRWVSAPEVRAGLISRFSQDGMKMAVEGDRAVFTGGGRTVVVDRRDPYTVQVDGRPADALSLLAEPKPKP